MGTAGTPPRLSRASFLGIASATVAAAGLVLAVWAGSALGFDGAGTGTRMHAGHLDYTATALLLVGVALLITGALLVVAAGAELVIEAQSRHDALARRASTVPPGHHHVRH